MLWRLAVKVAVMVDVTDTVQLMPVDELQPLHVPNPNPDAGEAVRVTLVTP